MKKVIITKGTFAGKTGYADTNILGYKLYETIMFYPSDGYCYRTAIEKDSYEFVKED